MRGPRSARGEVDEQGGSRRTALSAASLPIRKPTPWRTPLPVRNPSHYGRGVGEPLNPSRPTKVPPPLRPTRPSLILSDGTVRDRASRESGRTTGKRCAPQTTIIILGPCRFTRIVCGQSGEKLDTKEWVELGRARKGAATTIRTSGFVVAVCLLIILSPMAGSSATFSKQFVAPFRGTHSVYSVTLATGSASATFLNRSFFNRSNGAGGFSMSSWANSTHMVHPHRSSNNTSSSEGSAYISALLKFPFNNQSGTRRLTSVALHLTFSMRGNVSMVPGTCPYVNSTGQNNTCWWWAQASTLLEPLTLTPVGGGPVTWGNCSRTNGATHLSSCPSAYDQTDGSITNGSRGVWGWSSGANGTTKFNTGTWNVTMVFNLPKSVWKSEMLVVGFDIWGFVFSGFQSPRGAGGLSGARASAALDVAVRVISIDEA